MARRTDYAYTFVLIELANSYESEFRYELKAEQISILFSFVLLASNTS